VKEEKRRKEGGEEAWVLRPSRADSIGTVAGLKHRGRQSIFSRRPKKKKEEEGGWAFLRNVSFWRKGYLRSRPQNIKLRNFITSGKVEREGRGV